MIPYPDSLAQPDHIYSARLGMSHFCLKAFGVRTFSVRPPGVALRFTPGYTPVALSRAAKTKLIHPLAVADATTDMRLG